LGSPPSITATTEFVVPRSIPMIFAIPSSSTFYKCLKILSLTHTCQAIIRLECNTVNV
jgi:hypothetical protein